MSDGDDRDHAEVLDGGRDARAREEQRQRLRESNANLQTVTTMAGASLSFNIERLIDAAVAAASSICDGSAAIYMGAPEEPLRLASVRGFADAREAALPEVLPPSRFTLVRDALERSGSTRVLAYAPALAHDERLLLGSLDMQWAAAVPIRGHRGTMGLLLAFWRGASIAPGQLRVFEACAAQLAFASEHANFYRMVEALAEVSAALAGSLDYHGTLPTVARMLVPRVADICTIDVEESDAPIRVAVACADPIAPDLVQALEGHVLRAATASDGASAGDAVVEHVTDATLEALTDDCDHRALLRRLELRSSMYVPLAARGRTYGLLWLATSHSGRGLTTETQALVENIAERIGAAIDNARLFREAQQADRRKDEFLAMLSHELRTPLAPIMAWIQILKRSADPERIRTAVEVIERNVRLQATLIDDLLDLTAITRGKVALDHERHDLRTIVANALETVRGKTVDKTIVLAFEEPEEPLVVDGDGNRLQQVVWNLLANAVKFSPEGERVVVSLAREGDAALLCVRDRGAGIAPEFLPHIFDMFQQQEHGDRRRYGGLGIGLAIARSVTELHRGTIEAYSDGVGHGAEFRVRLPLASTETARSRASAAPSLAGRAVLLVEDVPDTREAAHVMLEHMGVRVLDAGDGREALAKLDEIPIDVVLCDLRMPIMDGFELIRRIREDPRHGALPVIAVSGYATHDDERRTREAGFDAYIRKPYVASTLAAAVERVIDGRHRGSTGARA